MVTFAAVAAATLSLFSRYSARRVPGERGATTAVLLFAVGLYLISPETHIGEWLYPRTGLGYLDTFIGTLCWIGALVALLHHVLDRLVDRDELVELFDALLRWPITLAVPLMLAALYVSRTIALAPVPDIGDAPADVWLVAYRVLYYGTCLYLAALLLRCLAIVRRQDGGRSCHVATLYMAAIALVPVGIALRVLSYVEGFWPLHEVIDVCRACTVLLVASGAALSWHRKVRTAVHTQCAQAATLRTIVVADERPEAA
ncbi:membrane protein [Mycobacterium phage KiSi]|uniref:Membrane protein n=1 Tax=Mycobacterium phage KiSi TaxID=2507856 RepID=A0A410TC28_9CAUD|nr:membrane protein [Mycobacterium phage KiSi]QAU06464.1 membrane protein [Mycobacterium phage KiSi]